MPRTRRLRYTLFGLFFALVIAALAVHSYALLGVLILCGLVLGIIADRIENHPTDKYRKYNALHEHHIHIEEGQSGAK